MEDWELDDLLEWDEFQDRETFLLEVAMALAEYVFLSDDDYTPVEMDNYRLGLLDPEEWWTLVNQLDEMVDLLFVVEVLDELDELLQFPGVPSQLLEEPLAFLGSVLAGDLPRTPAGRRVDSRKLVKIAQAVVRLVEDFPDTAQAAARAWADVYRGPSRPSPFDLFDEADVADLLSVADLPPAMSGFSMMIALTLMRWPERAEGLPLPPEFDDPEFYDEVLSQWEALPDNPRVTEEGTGEAEALFAQGQLAHTLAQTGTVELFAPEDLEGEDMALAYSRLSRAILWIHDKCRSCPERDEVTCKVAANWSERPVPLLDTASEVANTGRVEGCIRM